MKRGLAACVMACATMACTTMAGAARADDFLWQRGPSPAAIREVYPDAAYRAGVNGAVDLACIAAPDGALIGCRITREAPADRGFGVAALRLSLTLRAKPLIADQRAVRFPVYFDSPNRSAAALPDAPFRWLSYPKPRDLLQYYPARHATDVHGLVAMHCAINERHALVNCTAREVINPGYGFAAAALRTTSWFSAAPGVAAGAPQTGIDFTINFIPNAATQHFHAIEVRSKTQDKFVQTVVEIPWARTPSAAQMAAVYPFAARDTKTGVVSLLCQLDGDGHPASCETYSEEPERKGFETAARMLLPFFTAVDRGAPPLHTRQVWLRYASVNDTPIDMDPMTKDATYFMLTFVFHNPDGATPEPIAHPAWLERPDTAAIAADLGAAERASAICVADQVGRLADCKDEQPGGAASKAAAAMRLNPWADGMPAEGRSVKVVLEAAR